MKQYHEYPLWIRTQIDRAGSIKAWRLIQSERGKKARTTTHGFNDPEVRNKAIEASLKARGLKRKSSVFKK